MRVLDMSGREGGEEGLGGGGGEFRVSVLKEEVRVAIVTLSAFHDNNKWRDKILQDVHS